MMRIEAGQWLPATFARTDELADVLRYPNDEYSSMSAESKDELRQSQIEVNEIVRVLGFHGCHALIMKSDGVLGWISQKAIAVNDDVKEFEASESLRLSINEFFEYWKGTPYIWGGVTRQGIDCSGLTQRYYRDVLDHAIPKNSYNQRRAGRSKELAEIEIHDLIFCTRIGGRGIHHVGIFVGGEIWHAHGERGVIRQSVDKFLSGYQVLDVVEIPFIFAATSNV